MRPIAEVLNSRGDLSTFLVHLTRDDPGDPVKKWALANLGSMLFRRRIEARNAYGWAKLTTTAGDSQNVVCFSETPLQHIYSLVDIQGRRVNLEPFGLVFTKVTARRKGALPVWYVDHRSAQKEALDALLIQSRALGDRSDDHPAMKLFPFFELMGQGTSASGSWRKEFSWEREWRHVGHFEFDIAELALVIAPEMYHEWLQTNYPERPCVDARWSLERMIGVLAKLDPSSLMPFS